MNQRIGIIDIGSNSIRYMEAEYRSGEIHSLYKIVRSTKLAEGQDDSKCLQPCAMKRSADAVLFFAEKAKLSQVPVYAYATSAVREASNKEEFLSMISKEVPVSILEGNQEGQFAFLGATGGKGTLIDIGGGSVQIATRDATYSTPIGCVRLRDICPEESIPRLEAVMNRIGPLYFPSEIAVAEPVTGVGGTITTFGALLLGQTKYEGEELKNIRLTEQNIRSALEKIEQMKDEKKNHPLLKQRYNVILQGGIILTYLMKAYHISCMTPSDRDGMEGFADCILKSVTT